MKLGDKVVVNGVGEGTIVAIAVDAAGNQTNLKVRIVNPRPFWFQNAENARWYHICNVRLILESE